MHFLFLNLFFHLDTAATSSPIPCLSYIADSL